MTAVRYINTQSACIICNGPVYWVMGQKYGTCMRSVCRAIQPATIVRIIKGDMIKHSNVTDTTN